MVFKPCRMKVDNRDIVIRAPRLQEVVTISNGLTATYKHFGDYFKETLEEISDEEMLKANLKRLLNSSHSIVALLYVDKKYCGYCKIEGNVLKRLAHRATVTINLIPEEVEKGVGFIALKFLINKAKELGFGYLDAEICYTNIRALNLFIKAGFKAGNVVENAIKYNDGTCGSILNLTYKL